MRNVPVPGSEPALNISKLSYSIRGQQLINNIDMTLDSIGITMILGPNGAGKSLLLRLLHGLIEPSAGAVHWHGKPISDAVRRKQAMVFQRPVLLRRSVAANLDFVLRLHPRKRRADTDQLLEETGLKEKRSQPARQLSGGEQQRLALARALALQPELLFLDEPTASLDPASTQFIEQMVQRANEQGTHVMFVTHDIGQAKRLADQVVFMHQGSVVRATDADSFFEQPTHEAARAYLDGHLVL
jgi:tungstate transport system ATP-binding protein